MKTSLPVLGGFAALYTATRNTRNDTFGTPQPVSPVNTTSAEGWPSVTADGQNLFLESNVSGEYAIYVATRTTLVAQFSGPQLVANINFSGNNNGQVNVLPNESSIFFVSDHSGVSYDIYSADLGFTGQFLTPTLLSTIQTPSDEYGPTPSTDGLVLYFGSARPDSPSKGQMDFTRTTGGVVSPRNLYVATRSL